MSPADLTADQIAATDDTMSAPADLHPTLETVAEAPRFDIAKHYNWDAMTAARHEAQRCTLAARSPAQIRAQVAQVRGK